MSLQSLVTKAIKGCCTELRLSYWEINKKFRKTVTVSTKQGVFKFFLGPNESIDRSLYCRKHYGLDFMSNAMTFLRNIQKCPPKGEGTIVDIGANIGVTSIGMLYTGELDKAIAIEPEPRNFSLLQHNTGLNGLKDRVICLPYAVSYQQGSVPFELSDTNFGDHRVRENSRSINSAPAELFHESERRVITIQSDRLDNLLVTCPASFTHNIALIWIDVQGYEGYVFMGAKSLLSTGMPVVSEIWPYGIKRVGMTQEEFCAIASSIWKNYWVWRKEKFVKYPLHTLDIFFDELGYDGRHDNVIFTQ
jgi:FkbM family methyltransferase